MVGKGYLNGHPLAPTFLVKQHLPLLRRVNSFWELVELKMLDFSDHTRSGKSTWNKPLFLLNQRLKPNMHKKSTLLKLLTLEKHAENKDWWIGLREMSRAAPLVISVSGSVDLEALSEVWKPAWFHHGPVKGHGTIRYHPTLLTGSKSEQRQQQFGKKKHLLASIVLGVAVSNPGRTSYPNSVWQLAVFVWQPQIVVFQLLDTLHSSELPRILVQLQTFSIW